MCPFQRWVAISKAVHSGLPGGLLLGTLAGKHASLCGKYPKITADGCNIVVWR